MKTIKDFPNYKLTQDGILTNTTLGKVITPIIKNGYVSVRMSKNNKIHWRSLHRLMYETYLGNIPDGMHVDHINGIRTDNRIENLRLLTPLENNKNRKFLCRGENVNTNKLTEVQVMEIREAKSRGVNAPILAQKYGVNKSTINRIAKGYSWKHLPILPIDNSVWGNPKITGAISGNKLREKYGQDYFSKVAKAQKIKKHCPTCTCKLC
jgi:hypothetical protein